MQCPFVRQCFQRQFELEQAACDPIGQQERACHPDCLSRPGPREALDWRSRKASLFHSFSLNDQQELSSKLCKVRHQNGLCPFAEHVQNFLNPKHNILDLLPHVLKLLLLF